MLGIIAQLLLAPAVCLVDGLLHALRDAVGIHYHRAVDIACRASRRLRQCAVRTQEALLVGIENGHQGHLGQVQPLAQQVHAHQHAVQPFAQVAHYLHPLQRVHVAVDVVAADTAIQQVLRQLLCHAFGQRGHKDTLVALDALLYLLHKVVHLIVARTYLDDGVKQSRGTYHLLHHHAVRLPQLELGRCRTDIDHLPCHVHELLELQRPVVLGCRQAEAILHQVLLAGTVAAIHGAYLRHGDMALVDDHQEVLREEVEQTVGTCPWLAPVEVARIVLYTRTVAQLADHLHIIGHALLQAVCLDHLPRLLKHTHLCMQVVFNLMDGTHGRLLGGHEQVGRIDLVLVKLCHRMSCHGIHLLYRVHLVAPEHHAQHAVGVGQEDVDRVATDAEAATVEVHVVAHVQAVHQLAQEHIAAQRLAALHADDVLIEVRRVAHAVNARHRRHDQHILPSRQQCRRGRQPQLVYLVIDGQVLLYICVRRRQVGLRLIVVVV